MQNYTETTYMTENIFADEKCNPLRKLELFNDWLSDYIGDEKIVLTKEERADLYKDFERNLNQVI